MLILCYSQSDSLFFISDIIIEVNTMLPSVVTSIDSGSKRYGSNEIHGMLVVLVSTFGSPSVPI